MRIRWERTTRIPRGQAGVVATGAILLAAAAAATTLSRLTARPLPLLCPLKRFTGLPCPSCGGTRCVLSAVHGDLAAAVAWNPLVFVAVALFAVGIAVRVVAGRIPRVEASPWERRVAVALVAALVALNWAYLIAIGR